MKTLSFNTCKALASYMVKEARNGKYVVATLFYNEAMQLTKELFMYDDIDMHSICIESEEYAGYDKEYYISLADDMVACVEQAYRDDRYLYTDADMVLLDGNANSDILNYATDGKCYEIHIGDIDDENDSFDYVYDYVVDLKLF